jgi:hypothetical protein
LANEKGVGQVKFVEEQASGKISWHKRKIANILADLGFDDNLIVSELSRLARIFHERRGGNLNNPIKFKCLNKNQDDFRHDKVYQGKSIVPTLPRQNCGGRIC